MRLASSDITVAFLGGEPLLDFPRICKAVEYASGIIPTEKRVEYHISTNGLLMNETASDFLEEHRFEVQLSFDGSERAQDYRAKGTFADIDELLDRLRLRRREMFERNIRVCLTLVPATIPYLLESVMYLVKKGVCRIGISPSLIHHPDWTRERIEELDLQFAEICRESL